MSVCSAYIDILFRYVDFHIKEATAIDWTVFATKKRNHVCNCRIVFAGYNHSRFKFPINLCTKRLESRNNLAHPNAQIFL